MYNINLGSLIIKKKQRTVKIYILCVNSSESEVIYYVNFFVFLKEFEHLKFSELYKNG